MNTFVTRVDVYSADLESHPLLRTVSEDKPIIEALVKCYANRMAINAFSYRLTALTFLSTL